MNLRDQLKEILPEILPGNSAESIKGTELIRLVKFRLRQEYSDATLRYHFSILCCDPSSPIAKVEQGQGYYLRRPPAQNGGGTGRQTLKQARLGMLFETAPEAVDLALARAQKFRAIFARDMETAGMFPFLFESSFAAGAPYENVWKCPDAAVIDWEAGEVTDRGVMELDPGRLELKRALGLPPFTVTSVRLKTGVTYDSFREDVFQALSQSRWAQAGELVIAAPLKDGELAEQVRQLASEYGIGVRIYGLEPEELDELPPGGAIPHMSAREFEALQGRLKGQRLTVARPRALEWRMIEQVRRDNVEFQELFHWIQRCLRDRRAWTWEEFTRLEPDPVDGEG